MEQTGKKNRPISEFYACIRPLRAEVGLHHFRFGKRSDAINPYDIPAAIPLTLAGHLHRYQILQTPTGDKIVFSGSTERTSFAKRLETKGYCVITVEQQGDVRVRFKSLPTRTMFQFKLEHLPSQPKQVSILKSLPAQAHVKILLPQIPENFRVAAMRKRSIPFNDH